MIDELSYAFYKRDMVDNIYGEEYHHLFPDIDNKEIPPYMDDIGDELINTNDFIEMTLDLYYSEVGIQSLTDDPYGPPDVEEIASEIYLRYDDILSDRITKIYEKEIEERGESLTKEEQDELYDLINDSMYEEYVTVIGVTVEERIMRVLDFYDLVYVGEEFVKGEMGKAHNVYSKIFNSSQIPLFEMDYSNTWSEGGCYDVAENIERGYCNLLRTSMDIL